MDLVGKKVILGLLIFDIIQHIFDELILSPGLFGILQSGIIFRKKPSKYFFDSL